METILNQYDLRFFNQSSGGQNIKRAEGGGDANIGLFLTEFPLVDDIEEAIENTIQCMNGQPLPDPDWGGDLICVDITPAGVRFWGRERTGDYINVPLADFKQILQLWKQFLETRPYYLEKV